MNNLLEILSMDLNTIGSQEHKTTIPAHMRTKIDWLAERLFHVGIETKAAVVDCALVLQNYIVVNDYEFVVFEGKEYVGDVMGQYQSVCLGIPANDNGRGLEVTWAIPTEQIQLLESIKEKDRALAQIVMIVNAIEMLWSAVNILLGTERDPAVVDVVSDTHVKVVITFEEWLDNFTTQ